MEKRSKQPYAEARVGIFWHFDDRLIIDSTPMSKAEPYGDNLGHPTGHIDHWALLQQTGAVPPEVEYENPPRGRVVYYKRQETFHLLADRCILDRKDLIAQIKKELHLPKNTKTGTDAHYRCFHCLYGKDDDDDDSDFE
jgi:hypothetical protein